MHEQHSPCVFVWLCHVVLCVRLLFCLSSSCLCLRLSCRQRLSCLLFMVARHHHLCHFHLVCVQLPLDDPRLRLPLSSSCLESLTPPNSRSVRRCSSQLDWWNCAWGGGERSDVET